MDIHAMLVFILYAMIFVLGMGFISDSVYYGMNYEPEFYMLAIPILLPAFFVLWYFRTQSEKIKKIMLVLTIIISFVDIFILMIIYSAY